MKRTIGILALSLCCTAAVAGAGEYRPEVTTQVVLMTTTTAAGQPIVYPRTDAPQVTASVIEIPPGGETGWHTHPAPLYAWVVAGTLTVEFEGGKSLRYGEGDAIVEAVNTPQNGRNSGPVPVRLLVFATGAEDVPTAVKSLVHDQGSGRAHEIAPAKGGTEQRRTAPPPAKPATPPEQKDNSINIKLRYNAPVID